MCVVIYFLYGPAYLTFWFTFCVVPWLFFLPCVIDWSMCHVLDVWSCLHLKVIPVTDEIQPVFLKYLPQGFGRGLPWITIHDPKGGECLFIIFAHTPPYFVFPYHNVIFRGFSSSMDHPLTSCMDDGRSFLLSWLWRAGICSETFRWLISLGLVGCWWAHLMLFDLVLWKVPHHFTTLPQTFGLGHGLLYHSWNTSSGWCLNGFILDRRLPGWLLLFSQNTTSHIGPAKL